MKTVSRAGLAQLWRFYQAAALNTAFGFGLYAIFVACGINLFVAQAISFVCGTAFNYLTYSRHVFRGGSPAKARFAGAYAANYVMNVAFLAAFNRVFANHYAAGAAAVLAASLLNFVVLKTMVFARGTAG